MFLKKCSYQLIKNNDKIFFDSAIMLRFCETKVTKEKLYDAKEPIKIWDVNVDNIVITKLVETKTNSLTEFKKN